PLHVDVAFTSGVDALRDAELAGGDGLEDGFRFAHDARMQRTCEGVTVFGTASSTNGGMLSMWARTDHDAEWWRVLAPGAPGQREHAFRMLRAIGSSGLHQSVMAWSEDVVRVEIGDEIRIDMRDGSTH